MLRVYVFQAVQELWGSGAISLQGLREAIEWRLGVSLVHRKPAIRQLADEVADVMSQLPSTLNDAGRGRELFLLLSDIENITAWRGIWEPLPDQDRLGNRMRTNKTFALNVDACGASLVICEAFRPLLPLTGNMCRKQMQTLWKYGCWKGECSNQSPQQCLRRGTNNGTQVMKTIFKPMLCVGRKLSDNAHRAFWQGGNAIMSDTARVSRVPFRMNESIPWVENDGRVHSRKVGHRKAVCNTFMTDDTSVVFDRSKFALSACRLAGHW